jgi:hypothetical protein
MYKKNYGSLEGFKEHIVNDPMAVPADVAAVAGLLPGKAGQMARAIDPANMAFSTAGQVVAKAIPKNLPRNWYKSVMKFDRKFKGRKNELADTGLKYGIDPAKGEAAILKVDDLIDDFGGKIEDLVQVAAETGETVPAKAIYKYLKEVRDSIDLGLDAPADLRAIDKYIGKHYRHLKMIGKEDLGVKDLLKIKRAAYKRVDYNKKAGKGSQAKTDTRKAVARASRELSEELVPGIKALNAEQGKLLDFAEPLANATSRIENLNLSGISAPLQATAFGHMGGKPAAWLGYLQALKDNPAVKGKAAIAMHNMQKAGLLDRYLGRSQALTDARYGLLSADRANEELRR